MGSHHTLAIACAIALGSAAAASADDTSHEHHRHHEVPAPVAAEPAPEADLHAGHADHASDAESDEHAAHGAHHHAGVPAPIGVMGDHTHEAGGWMLSYRYSRMRMQGNRDGTDRIDEDEIVMPGGSHRVSPRDMDMEMHVFGAMVAPTDWATLTAMIPYVELGMNHVTMTGQRFETRSQGVGDLKLTGLFTVLERAGHHVHLHAGLSAPTGGIGHKDRVPVPGQGFFNRRLPYPMQIGSGTWDLLPGLTYTGSAAWLSWGLQSLGTLRLGHGHHGYRLGNRADSTAWIGVPILGWLSLTARIQHAYWGNVNNDDDTLDANAVPTANPDLRAGHRIDLLGGINIEVPLGAFGAHTFGVEAGAPVYQWLDGPQLETDWRLLAGWKLQF